MKKNIVTGVKTVIVFVIILISYALPFSVKWIYNNFGNIGLEEIAFQIAVPMTGANTDYYFDYAKNAFLYIILCTIATYTVIAFIFRKRKKYQPKRMKGTNRDNNSLVVYKKLRIDKRFIGKFMCSLLVFILCTTYAINKTELITYMENRLSESSIIKDEYVNPKDVKIEFPENKRNLIYIYLESMEATFYSQENGGAFEESLIEDLEELAKDNIAFSNSDSFKGLYSLSGSGWTTGAMTAQTTGLPLKIPIDANSYGNYSSFLPGATAIGDILKENGYNQMLAIGSNATFGGRDHLFKQHGDYEIFDFSKAVKEGKKKKEDFIWWGFPDSDLFEYSKEKLTMLASEDKPFNFTMLTVDTHTTNGFLCEECQDKFDNQYFNVINCSSRRVKKFIEWIIEQDFYDNTTIILCGDHPSMQPDTFEDIEKNGYERTVLNIIINPAYIPANTKNKNGSTMDMFPTTLASIGAKIDGNKLGLGTNLFSNEETLIGKYGLDYADNELEKNSKYYNTKILYGF